MPTVHFTPVDPVYTVNDTVSFQMVVDGDVATCEVSSEALQDHFGAMTHKAADLVSAAKQHRGAIEAVAKQKAPARLAAGRALLMTNDF